MAIKGKGKTRGRRSVAPAPRPVIVTRKPPFLRRRWVWITVAVILLLVIMAAITISVRSSARKAFDARQARAVAAYSDQVIANLPPETQTIGSDTLFLFPSLSSDLDSLASGATKPAASAVAATTCVDDAKKAADAIGAMDTAKLISPDFVVGTTAALRSRTLTQATLTNSQFLMVKALGLYQNTCGVWKSATAATVTAADRKALVANAKALGQLADETWGTGWAQMTQVRSQAGLAPLQAPTTASPQPTAAAPTSAAPTSASPTPSG